MFDLGLEVSRLDAEDEDDEVLMDGRADEDVACQDVRHRDLVNLARFHFSTRSNQRDYLERGPSCQFSKVDRHPHSIQFQSLLESKL